VQFLHDRQHPLFDRDAEEQNMVDVMQSVSAEKDGMLLGPGGHNGALGSKHVKMGLQDG
jgi:hypothetical protein